MNNDSIVSILENVSSQNYELLMYFGHPLNVPLMKIEACVISRPIK